MTLRYTLLSDGSSDRVLLPVITWLLQQHAVGSELRGAWADLRNLREPPSGLSERIARTLELYPCELLFVHRDAEGTSPDDRREEIARALAEIGYVDGAPVICVVPVRMQEAWLLLDQVAIRKAAGNPQGKVPLGIPAHNRIEGIADPKELLYEALRVASEKTGRRLRKLHLPSLRYRIVELIEDFSTLRALSAFAALEAELRAACHQSARSDNRVDRKHS